MIVGGTIPKFISILLVALRLNPDEIVITFPITLQFIFVPVNP